MTSDITIDNENLPIFFESLKENKLDYSKKDISIQKQLNKNVKIKKSQKAKDNLWNSLKS